MATIDLNIFFLAARNGDISILKKSLNSGIDIHSCDDMALRIAVKANQSKAILFLISRGASISAVYDEALRGATLRDDVETVQSLLANDYCSQEAKIYAMYNAIFCQNQEIIKLLLENGVSPTANNNAVLNVARFCGDSKIMAMFENYLN